MIGFILGCKLSLQSLRNFGRQVFCISVFEVLGVAGLILVGLSLLGVPIEIALVLAGIAPASAPAAVTNVVEGQRAKVPFTDTLLGIVAIDDAWGLIVFSVLLSLAMVIGGQGHWAGALATGGWELAGAVLIGLAVGLPAALLTDRIRFVVQLRVHGIFPGPKAPLLFMPHPWALSKSRSKIFISALPSESRLCKGKRGLPPKYPTASMAAFKPLIPYLTVTALAKGVI